MARGPGDPRLRGRCVPGVADEDWKVWAHAGSALRAALGMPTPLLWEMRPAIAR